MAVLGKSRQTAQHRALEMRWASFSCIPEAAAALESKLLPLLLVAPPPPPSNNCFLAGGSPLPCVSSGTPTTLPPPTDEEDDDVEEEEAEEAELVVATTWLSPRSGRFEDDGGCWTAELEDSTDMIGNFLGIMFVVFSFATRFVHKLPHTRPLNYYTHTSNTQFSLSLFRSHTKYGTFFQLPPFPAVRVVSFSSVFFRSVLFASFLSADTSARQKICCLSRECCAVWPNLILGKILV